MRTGSKVVYLYTIPFIDAWHVVAHCKTMMSSSWIHNYTATNLRQKKSRDGEEVAVQSVTSQIKMTTVLVCKNDMMISSKGVKEYDETFFFMTWA